MPALEQQPSHTPTQSPRKLHVIPVNYSCGFLLDSVCAWSETNLDFVILCAIYDPNQCSADIQTDYVLLWGLVYPLKWPPWP